MKHATRSKTILANLAIVGVAYGFQRSTFYVDPLVFIWTIAALNIGLRAVTRQALTWRW